MIPKQSIDLRQKPKFIEERALDILIAQAKCEERKHIKARWISAKGVIKLDLNFPRLECKRILEIAAEEEFMQKPREKLVIDPDTMRYLRDIERAKFAPCRSTDLVESVHLSSMRVLPSPVARELLSWPQTDSFVADIGVYVFDEIGVDFVADFCEFVKLKGCS